MKEPTGAQIKEFWEKCGFTLEELHSLESDEPYFVLHKPDGEQYNYWIGKSWDNEIPVRKLYPPIDLNNLFKYAVTKSPEYTPDIRLIQHIDFDYGRCSILDVMGEEYVGESQDPALALFWAIWECIKC